MFWKRPLSRVQRTGPFKTSLFAAMEWRHAAVLIFYTMPDFASHWSRSSARAYRLSC